MVIDLSIADPYERVKAFWNLITHNPNENYSRPILPHLTLLTSTYLASKSRSTTTFSLTVPLALCNASGNLHGGAAATVFDICTSVAIAPHAAPGFWTLPGVSRTLGCTYVRPVPVGSVCRVECEVVGVGRRLVALRGVLRRVGSDGEEEDGEGEVCVICEHGKVSIDPVKL